MRNTQLSCPTCHSLLNFGENIVAGMTVPCLICGQAFVAADSAAADCPAPSNAPAVLPVAPDHEPPGAAAPAAAEAPMLLMIDAPATPPPLPVEAAPARQHTSPDMAQVPARNNQALLAAGLVFAGLAILLIAGMSLVLWTVFGRQTPAAADSNAPPAPAPAVAQAPGDESRSPTAPNQGSNPPAGHDVDLADLKNTEPPKPTGPLTDRVIARSSVEPGAAPIVPVAIVGGVPGVDQQRIDAAIDKGVRYLKNMQQNAVWAGAHDIGFTALAGLTLLECKVPPDDPSILRAAGYIRHNVGNMNRAKETYELSLAILFLDRLGNPKDDVLIQGMALRLMSGQNEAGGWTYRSHYQLTPPEMQQLLVFLKSHRPPPPLARAIHPPAGDLAKQMQGAAVPPKQVQDKSDDPFKQLADLLQVPKYAKDPTVSPGDAPTKQIGSTPADPKDNKANKPVEGNPPPPDPAKKVEPNQPTPKGNDKGDKPAPPKKVQPIPLRNLLPRLQQLPVAKLNAAKGKLNVDFPRGEDNSNTQFALMGLWAARRHDVPTEYSLQLGQQRFIKSQNADGGWGYHVLHGSTKTMTCVGLIGLAMGHGVNADVVKDRAKQQDMAIQNGLRALGQQIGTPVADLKGRPPEQPNLYFLWSLERVAMLYDLKTIGGKDWYGWGAQALVANQHGDGHWSRGQYPGANDHCDTCFALLFLKRSNLVPDLTENLRLYMAIRDPEAK
jgi:hypothetical protein